MALFVWHLCAAALAVINEWSTGYGKLCQFGSALIWEISEAICRELSPLICYMELTNQRNLGRSLTCEVEIVGCYIAVLCLAADWYNFVILFMSVPIVTTCILFCRRNGE